MLATLCTVVLSLNFIKAFIKPGYIGMNNKKLRFINLNNHSLQPGSFGMAKKIVPNTLIDISLSENQEEIQGKKIFNGSVLTN